MSGHVADLMIKGLVEGGKVVRGSKVLVMGLAFKENIRDTRNSKIFQSIEKLKSYGVQILAWDPHLTREEVEGFGLEHAPHLGPLCDRLDGIILATFHKAFEHLRIDDLMACFNGAGSGRGVIVDVPHCLGREMATRSDSSVIYKCL